MNVYLLSLPERVLRSVSALAGGLVRELGNAAIPGVVRRTSLYRNLVELTLRFLIEQVGQVPDAYPDDAPAADQLAHDFLLRRAAGHGLSWAGLVAFQASPVWVTAALADLSGTGRHLIREIAITLRQEGLLQGDESAFETMDQLLDGVERSSEQLTRVFTSPPLRVSDIRKEWHALRDEVRRIPGPHLPSSAQLEAFWSNLMTEAKAQRRPVAMLAGGMAFSAVTRVPANLLWLGSASLWSVHRTGELTANALLEHYGELLREIRRQGFGPWWTVEFRPYLKAAAMQFSPEHQSSTEKIFR